MGGELTVNKSGLVSAIQANGIANIIEPLKKEICLFDTYIAGTTHLEDKSVLELMKVDDKLILQREDNKFDSDAILILNTDKKKFTILFVVCTVVNLLSAVMACVDGRMVEAGKLQLPIVNALCAVLFIVIAITIGLRKMADKKEECE